MANYVYVENNIIKEYYDFLPQNWRNISGFNLINDENYLKSVGWYKVIKNEINYDSSCQRIINYEYIFDGDKVQENIILENFSPSEEKNVPSSITATQIRLWLVKNNISLESIEQAINSLENDSLRKELLVKWEYVPYFERNNIFINQIGDMLGLTSQQIDQAFIEASDYT
jgi:hypothetical protein